MHQPRPYGLHVKGGELTTNDEAFINITAKSFTNLKQVNHLDNIKRVYDLPDGGYVVFVDMGGNFRVIADKSQTIEDVLSLGLAKYHTPMLFSGVIDRAVIKEGEGVVITITEQTRKRLSQYHREAYPPKRLELKRFVVGYANNLQEFLPQQPSDKIYTQYAQLRPTWYSGAMAEVVQIIGGYGKQFGKDEKIDSGVFTPYETINMEIPSEVKDKIIKELGNQRLPAYLGEVQPSISYDYKYARCHGISFDNKNNPWLLRIDKTGVWVMPMPMIPATTTTAFREYIEGEGDSEILAIFDRFGGMPSGEDFPSKDEDFYAWVRAGAIIKVCDTGDFYNAIAYSTACGWSLNLTGIEGYNTCYRYGSDGIAWGYTYKLKIRLQAIDNRGWVTPDDSKLPDEEQKIVSDYTNQLILSLPLGTPKALAILYKLRKTLKKEIYKRANTVKFDSGKEIDYWDNLVIKPQVTQAGSVSLVYAGRLYHDAKPEFQPQIKFPNIFMQGCVSFDFSPLDEQPKKKPNCDTVMFAYYVGDDLKTVKYFVDWDKYIQQEESNYEEFMYAGSWEKTETKGFSGTQGYFYTSDIDNREDTAPFEAYTTIEGKDLGYDSKPYFAFDEPFSMTGTLWRNRYYTHLEKSRIDTNRQLDLAVCIPYFCRNLALIATKDTTADVFTSEHYSLSWVGDPTYYRYWTYSKAFAWKGMDIKNPKGNPYPVDGNPVWVEEMHYAPSPANEFADNGDWVGGLPADYTWLINPDGHTWAGQGGGNKPKVKTYNIANQLGTQTKGKVQISINDQAYTVNNKIPHGWYYRSSPDDNGEVFYRDANKILFGQSVYASTNEPDNDGKRKYWGYSKLANHKAVQNFIGVINE